jgi:hypothetical protein
MKHLIYGAALSACTLAGPAYAKVGTLVLSCTPSSEGNIAGSTIVKHGDEWTIEYKLRDGRVASLSKAYDMQRAGVRKWWGKLRSNPAIEMRGQIEQRKNHVPGEYIYTESRYKDGQLVDATATICHRLAGDGLSDVSAGEIDDGLRDGTFKYPSASAAPAAPPQTPASPPPIPAQPATPAPQVAGNIVPIEIDPRDGHSIRLNVKFGSYPSVTVTLDTGASRSVIPQDMAEWLVQHGDAEWGQKTSVTLANGQVQPSWFLHIYQVSIGANTVDNCWAYVAPANADILLGMATLDALGPFKIDKPRKQLVFG